LWRVGGRFKRRKAYHPPPKNPNPLARAGSNKKATEQNSIPIFRLEREEVGGTRGSPLKSQKTSPIGRKKTTCLSMR